jgi:MOSC domain-containing protein YiiM
VGAEALGYFKVRVTRGRADGEEGLAFVVANATSRALQEACVGALVRKTGVMAVVLTGGEVHPGDAIAVELPDGPPRPLEVV